MDEKKRKAALRMLSYGVYIITSKNDNDICASTVTWVSQMSFEPPLISVCIKKKSATYSMVKERKEFCLHLLGDNQKTLAASFFKHAVIEDGDLNGHPVIFVNDLPVLIDAPAYLTCSVLEIINRGDHPLFLAEVKDAIVQKKMDPLELSQTGWSYGG